MNLEHTLNAIAAGDDQAMARLYREYSRFVFGFVRHRMGNHADVEEVVQDVFLAVARKPSAFGDNSDFTTYLCGIARHKIADRFRSAHASLSPITDPLSSDESETLPIEDPDAEEAVYRHVQSLQTEEQLMRCMDRLPDLQRETFFWTYFQDEDVSTVAQRMSCAVGTVKSRLHHARIGLMRCLSRWYREVSHA
jgi:RNA polymerase sigma-70 factor, ECF subfamily